MGVFDKTRARARQGAKHYISSFKFHLVISATRQSSLPVRRIQTGQMILFKSTPKTLLFAVLALLYFSCTFSHFSY